ncbi:uncharacterized protein [Macrobrachium rosenbergii]|uniref:uncharacterized protein n=1 Tax=Macrobrachium rosenbergii TaxID=79674 RepID=UPI0034D70453
MEKYIKKGYAQPLPSSKLKRDNGLVWYMPHHSMHYPTKPKIRVVFNLKARYKGTSLNDNLLQGPDMTNTLVGTLLRFKNGQHAVTADIEEMFHQVKVPVHDRDLLCFPWWPKGDTTQDWIEYKMGVHVFGAQSSPS